MKTALSAVSLVLGLMLLPGCQSECKPGQDADCWIDALKDPKKIEKAIDNLKQIGDKKAEAPLIEAFKATTNPKYRERIAEIFRKWGTKSAVPILIASIDFTAGPDKESMKSKRLNRMNQKIASALGELGDKSAIQPLIRLMKVTKSPNVQRAAIRALGELGATEAVDELLAIVNDTTAHKIIRMNAIYALGEIGDPKAVDTLVLCLYRDKAIYFFQARLALAKIGKPAVPALTKTMLGRNIEANKIVETNIEVLKGAIEANAALTLGDIGDPSAAEPILETIKKVEAWEAETNKLITLTRLITALGNLGDKRGLAFATKYLGTEYWDVRYVCAEAINKISDRSALEALYKYATTGGHPKTRAPLIDAIGNLGTDEYLEKMQQMAKQPQDPTVKKALDATIKRLQAYKQCKQNVQCWISKLDDKEEAVREKAAYELGRLNAKQAVDALVKHVGDQSEAVRFGVMFALDRIGSTKPIPAIKELLKKEKGSTRFKVANFNYEVLMARLKNRSK